MMRLRFSLALVAIMVLGLPAGAWAQGAVSWYGPVTAGHLAMQLPTGQFGLIDAGGASGFGIAPQNGLPGTRPTGIGMVNSGLVYCAWSNYSNAASYAQLCLGFDGSNNGLISLSGVGVSPTFSIAVNNTKYPFPGPGSGNVLGPVGAPGANDAVCFNGTNPTLIKDCGFPPGNVTGPGSATVGHIATYNNTGGTLVSDPGIPLVAGILTGGFAAHANGLIETNPGDFANTLYTANGGGILSGWWQANGSTYLGISARISGADDPPNYTGAITSHDAPRNALTAVLINTGSLKDGVAVMGFGLGNAANTATWGGNLIAASSARFSDTVKLVGLEIDVQFADPATAANPNGAGLYINLFNNLSGGPMIQGGATGTGTAWTNGILLPDIKSPGTGLAFGSLLTQNPGSLINTVLPVGRGYTDAAISLSQGYNGANGQLIKFVGADITHLTLMSMSTTNNFVIAYDGNVFFTQAGNNAMQLTVTTGLSLAVTSLAVFGHNNAGSSLLGVTMAAADSAGAGFRALRVAN